LRKAAPLGDPLELFLRGYTLTLRRADAGRVWVEPASGPPPTAPGTRP
ncbi:MAG: ferrous iron transport protein A, partial [Oscillospiraceae bacterium]|nr:ferrous iron transport protein A [Oscillospiraceae bacterium]